MGERKSAMDLRFLRVFWRKEIVEVCGRVDPYRVLIAERLRASEQVVLNLFEYCRQCLYHLRAGQECLFSRRTVASRKCDRTFVQIAWSKFNANRSTAFDPFPIFCPTAEIASIHLDENGFAGVALLLKLSGQSVSSFPNSSPMFRLWYDRQNYC